ncbi:MAG: SDR family oxidoreductase [SAR202 cluster bacterium]|nr:SDR family oxidoreductase [SAR202 cluster bacterium]
MQTPNDFAGKVAIVTGAGQGMGRAVAVRLAEGGAKVLVNDKRMDAVKTVVDLLKAKKAAAIGFPGDVTSKKDVDRMVQTAVEMFGGVHILINNAGILFPTKLIDMEEDEWDLVIDVNMKGTYLCTRAVLPHMMKQKWGRIVNFSSTAGKNVSTLGGPHYTAAKAGVLGLTRATAKEVARFGITCNSVCPGLIDTEMVRANVTEERLKRYLDSFPISRIGEPWEVAEMVAFLASDRAAYVTGASLDINGGDLMI